MAKELWDAYDREGNLLGFDLVRGEPIPAGAFPRYRGPSGSFVRRRASPYLLWTCIRST